MRSINDFKSTINKLGNVKSNRFEVTFSGPYLPTSWKHEDLRFLCESVNIPGTQVLTTDFKLYGGQPITKIPNGRAFDEVQMTFVTTGDMRDKYWFDEWIGKITDHTTNTISYYDNVASNIKIDVFNEVKLSAEAVSSGLTGNINPPTITPRKIPIDLIPIYSIQLIKAIPTRVETTQLSWGDTDQLFKYTVNFAYESIRFMDESNRTKLVFKHLDKVQL